MISYICDDKPSGKVTEKIDKKVDPHLHIVLLAYPGSMICKKIKAYLEHKVGKPDCINMQRIYDISKLRDYIDQFRCFRTLLYDQNKLSEFHAAAYSPDRFSILDDIENYLFKNMFSSLSYHKEVKTLNFWIARCKMKLKQ